MRLFGLLITVFIISSAASKHEFYVSITDLHIRQDTVQIAIKVFTHDLEEVIKDETGQAIFLDNTSNTDKTLRRIRDYTAQHFSLGNGIKAYDLTWIGHEYEADVTWIYAYTIIDPKASLLYVRNTLLTTDQRNQHNMVHLNLASGIESKICTASNPEARFSIR